MGVKTALVVDDDDAIRRFIRIALQKRGWDVLEAEDGVDGVARFMLHGPHVLVTDLSMPRSDGFEMLEILRKAGLLHGVRVIVISGVLNLTDEIRRKTGAVALLQKPFTLAELYAAVGA